MDLLMTTVVDIATLAATCRALRAAPPDAARVMRKRLRSRLRTQLRGALRAYIGVLAKAKRVEVDHHLVAACRAAAEQRMPDAVERQAALQRLMSIEAGALDGYPAARQDLWRLAHLILSARMASTRLEPLPSSPQGDEATQALKAIRRALRRSLVAYARSMERPHADGVTVIRKGRAAALQTMTPMEVHESTPAPIARLVQGLREDWAVRPMLEPSPS